MSHDELAVAVGSESNVVPFSATTQDRLVGRPIATSAADAIAAPPVDQARLENAQLELAQIEFAPFAATPFEATVIDGVLGGVGSGAVGGAVNGPVSGAVTDAVSDAVGDAADVADEIEAIDIGDRVVDLSAARAAHQMTHARRRTRRARTLPVSLFAVDLVSLSSPAAFLSTGRLALVAFALMCLLLLRAAGDYQPRLRLSVLDELPRLVRVTLAAGIGMTMAVSMWTLQPGVQTFACAALIGAVLQVTMRALFYTGVAAGRRRGHLSQRAIIVGGGVVAGQLIQTLESDRRYGLTVVGSVDGDEDDYLPSSDRLGSIAELDAIVSRLDIDTVIVSFGSQSDADLATRLRRQGLFGPAVYVVPRLFDVYAGSGHSLHIGAVPITRVRPGTAPSVGWAFKRVIDVAVSGLAIVLLGPVLLAVAAAVRLEGGKGVLFRQVRVGRNGQLFELLKFRSMTPASEHEQQTTWNVAEDDRIGPVGRFLRRSSIDELPQLLNVLRGEMSLVGPRPERPHFVDSFLETYLDYEHRHRVRVGLTGLAQVNGLRGDTSIADRARFDNYYIDNWSLWLDVKIMVSTIGEVVGARGR